MGARQAHRHLRRAGAEDLGRLSAQMISIVARSARIADGQHDAGRPRTSSRRARPPPSGSCSSGAARPTRGTSRRSTRTGSAPPSTASTPRRSPRASSPRPAPTAAPRSPRRSARSPARCTAARPRSVLPMLERSPAAATPVSGYVDDLLDSGERMMGFGHRIYRAEDPRARLLRGTAQRARLAALRGRRGARAASRSPELHARKPDRVLATNVEFWSAVVLDVAEIPPPLAPAMFACSRTAGWSAHIIEQKRTRPARPPVGDVRRPRRALALGGLSDRTLARGRRAGRGATRARGDEQELARLRARVGRRARGGGAQPRLPRAGGRLPVRSRSSASARSSSSCAAGSRTRARRCAARR